ncbi:GroES-like protein [Coniophora puteana RWD-64-598 SS2]|uniref:GroES-like protein n=1 Tax=Coniophora puteana (strain RWD-64-598) TaxID=741705 RepID=A0A5M3ME13_CONPW|nr:GroES-like protein [Coniophora puteana RWD-64-598 SS2]EIW77130.1 GroES-like protein [Coniophora puteana RWD-64-598 SS2]
MSQKALVIPSKQAPFVLTTRPIPKPGQGQILIKVESVTLNPIDQRIQSYGLIVEDYPAVIGYGIAGVVTELGEGVIKFSVGDKVATSGSAGKSDFCGYQQFALGDVRFTAKIPLNLSFDKAATLGVSLETPAIGLFGPYNAKLTSLIEHPGAHKGQTILILGGSASLGQYGKFILLSCPWYSNIITTALPTHEILLRTLGATHVVDHRLPAEEIISMIKSTTANNSIKIVYDTISDAHTQAVGWGVLAEGGHMVVTPKGDAETRTFAWTYGSPHTPPHYEFGEKLWDAVYGWFESGTLVPNKVELLPGGLEGIVAGLERLRDNKVSGVKLAVHPQETA